MMSEFSWELIATVLVSVIAFFAIGIPYWRGLRLALMARSATRIHDEAELYAALDGPVQAGEPLALVLLRVLESSLRENDRGQHPTAFLRDASRQYAMNAYDTAYAQKLSMYANLLPPIGFIGTTLGLMILFASMHLSNQALEVGALGIALTSTIFALVGFASLEALKIRLYSRLLGCIDHALGVSLGAETVEGARSATEFSAAAPAN